MRDLPPSCQNFLTQFAAAKGGNFRAGRLCIHGIQTLLRINAAPPAFDKKSGSKMLHLLCRQPGSGNSLADILLLALAVPEESREGDMAAARSAQGKALATLAFLLEVRRFEPVQYLLGGGNGTRVEPPLAQRLFLLAEHLEASWQGALLLTVCTDCQQVAVGAERPICKGILVQSTISQELLNTATSSLNASMFSKLGVFQVRRNDERERSQILDSRFCRGRSSRACGAGWSAKPRQGVGPSEHPGEVARGADPGAWPAGGRAHAHGHHRRPQVHTHLRQDQPGPHKSALPLTDQPMGRTLHSPHASVPILVS